MPVQKIPLIERFEAKFNKAEGQCWLWRGSIHHLGYGQVRVGRKVVKAHRVAYELANGPIPEGMLVCHTCDVRNCVNPAHLFLGTHSDNMRDCTTKGRAIGRAKVTAEQALDIRKRIQTGAIRQVDAMRQYSLSAAQVSRIASGKRWGYIAQ